MAHNDPTHTSFGFRDVAIDEKQGLVRGVFDRVAGQYDIMNDMMSLGVHRLWKAHFIRTLPLNHPHITMLDMAGGTGDIAFHAYKARGKQNKQLAMRIMDINHDMLCEGHRRAQKNGMLPHVDFMTGNAEQVPLASASVDIYTISLGIRNVTHRAHALREAYRVLKPGGCFACLEFSPLADTLFGKIYDAYSFHLVPAIGKLIVGDSEPYRYLVESIRRFPHADDFATEIKAAGFSRVGYTYLSNGIVAIHKGWRL